MTRKHFQALAEAVATTHGLTSAQRSDLAERLATVCAATNPQFDRARFLKACGIDTEA